ncbi:MAG: type II toxin-antitoxin system RelE/ParE family toxin [Cyclobacteriaceae bacterium]|nr:type II toxin-antitoxin system RelE/ParE family toxin [Cyclobacteriaceae bacterium]
MKYSLVFSSEAEKEIIESIHWYNNQKKNLGFDFFDQLNLKLDLIIKNPLNYSTRFTNIRATKITKYPYLIYFKINDHQSSIAILAVLHTSRDPKEISKRK